MCFERVLAWAVSGFFIVPGREGEGVNFYIKLWVDITVVISFIVGRTYGGANGKWGYTEEPR